MNLEALGEMMYDIATSTVQKLNTPSKRLHEYQI